MKPTQKTGTARLLQLAATKKLLVAASALLAAVAAVASFVPYIAIYLVIRTLVGSYPEIDAAVAAQLINYGWLALGGVLANILLYFAALMCSHLAAFSTLYKLKVQFASHLARLPLGFHLLVGSGKLRKIMDDNIEKIEGFIAHQLPDIVAATVSPIVMLVILFAVDWRFGLAAALIVMVAFVIQMRAYGNDGAREMMRRYQASLEEMNNATVEYVRGISVVKAFNQTAYSFKHLHSAIKAYTAMVIPYTLSWENYMTAFTTLLNSIYLFLLPVGIVLTLLSPDHAAIASSFIFYLVFVPAISGIMMKTLYVSSNSMQIIGGVEAMDKILAAPALPQPAHGRKAEGFDIEFSDVVFSYDDIQAGIVVEKDGAGEQPAPATNALNGISFVARQGQVTALVGPSGGGKSTIAHLIPRFFDVSAGSVRIGGVDIREMDSHYLMDQVGFVFQDVYLFRQSVRDNIRMGRPSASDERVEAAARAAQCHEFIERLPQGYDTVLGVEGIHLSGGERQRIAIARAIIKDAPIVVLDEATAFADPENEHLIQKAFEELLRNKTVIIIAHRLSTVRSADTILVVEEGRIVEQGTHDGLLARQQRYAAMWRVYTESLGWTIAATDRAANAANVPVLIHKKTVDPANPTPSPRVAQ